VKFGVTMLFLTLVYASVLSALAPLRSFLEVTEMGAFRHWLFGVLIVLLCASVTVVTFTRIRWNAINAGVLTVHAGILVLCGGSLLYFGGKLEGDVILRSPQIELVSLAGQPRPIASLLPEKGQAWRNNMPGLGGEVELEVIGVEHAAGVGAPTQALVRTRIGNEPEAIIPVLADATAPTPLSNNRLGLRLTIFPPEQTFYDNEAAAFYFRKSGDAGWQYVSLPALPFFRERYLDEGYTLTDTESAAIPSKRTSPAVSVGGLTIPTHWFESWRLPIEVPLGDAPFDLSITGFVPYVAGTRSEAVADPLGAPAARIRIGPPGMQPIERTLMATEPQASYVALATPIEFRHLASPEERAALLRPLAGPDELEVEVRDPPATLSVAITAGQKVAVPGTDYELTISQLIPNWPLVTPGFENAVSPVALVDVQRGALKYQRTVIQRFPQLSQDIDANGVRKRDGLLDENIKLRYRTARGGYVLLLSDDAGLTAGEVTLAAFDEQGKVTPKPFKAGVIEHLTLAGMHVDFTVQQLLPKARRVTIPVLEPRETRRPNLAARSMSSIRLAIRGKETLADWNDSRWVFFSQYPHVDPRPLTITTPAGESWEFIYTRRPRAMDATLIPGKLSVKFFPGRRSVESWRSDFTAQVGGQPPVAASVSTNETFNVGPWTLFQSGASQDHWSYTILGVGNRLGIWPMVLGCVMITLGSMYAFYVKPVLRRRAIEQALAAQAAGPTRTADLEAAPSMNGGRQAVGVTR
jgi:hypothetical protein